MKTYLLQTPDGDFIVQTNRGDLLAKYMSDDIGGIQVSEEHADEILDGYSAEDLLALMIQEPFEEPNEPSEPTTPNGNEIVDDPQPTQEQSERLADHDNRSDFGCEAQD
jgi:hypothetical protein